MAQQHQNRVAHLKAWHASGLSQAEYCRHHDINPNTFCGWLRGSQVAAVQPPITLATVTVTAAAPLPDSPLHLQGSGWTLQLPSSTPPTWLAQLLSALT